MNGQASTFKQLGQKGTEFQGFETFPTPSNTSVVRLSSAEFTSLCPVTGQPDFQEILIEYQPNKKCLESKSLKLYLMTFRDRGAFCEALADEIGYDLFVALDPHWLSVEIHQKPRGGISISSRAAFNERNFTFRRESSSEVSTR